MVDSGALELKRSGNDTAALGKTGGVVYSNVIGFPEESFSGVVLWGYGWFF